MATAVYYPFTIKISPMDLNGDGNLELFVNYGNAYTSGQSMENILFVKNETGDYQKALSYTGDPPRIYADPALSFPEVLVQGNGNVIHIHRLKDGRFILNRESDKFSAEYSNSRTLLKAQPAPGN